MKKYKTRVDHREFLNLPGFHGGASVYAYIEDTSERDVCDGTKNCSDYSYREEVQEHAPHHFGDGRMILEVRDCSNDISLDFQLDTASQRQNSFYKIDTLITALMDFRQGMVEEAALVRKRDKKVKTLKEEYDKKKKKKK